MLLSARWSSQYADTAPPRQYTFCLLYLPALAARLIDLGPIDLAHHWVPALNIMIKAEGSLVVSRFVRENPATAVKVLRILFELALGKFDLVIWVRTHSAS